MLQFHLKACSKCGGDLALDQGDWYCLQCGKYYYARLYQRFKPPEIWKPGQAAPTPQTPEQKGWHVPRISYGMPGPGPAAVVDDYHEPVIVKAVNQNAGLTRPGYRWTTGDGLAQLDNSGL